MAKTNQSVAGGTARGTRKRVAAVSEPVEKSESHSVVHEPDAALYGYSGQITLKRLLDLSSAVAKAIFSEFDIINLGVRGLTRNSINSLAFYSGISRKYIAENIFDVSVKTIERKDDKARLDKKTSSHAVEIAKVLQHTYEIFRDEEKARRWLNRENRALNNLKPVELFDTLSGLRLVDNILTRIEEGVYS